LAIRQSVTAGVNITYKILYNDAVAMTGGQPVGERPEGHSVLQIAQSMQAEGVRLTTIVTDEPYKYDGVALPAGVQVFHRDQLERIQLQMREIEGTTIIIYDQTCATEKRRRRKRGQMVDPALRVVINEEVCEGCGDCGVKSNCLSVEPLVTPLGRKRAINQSTCNKDLSCANGFCPSFVTVQGGQLKGKRGATSGVLTPPLDLPVPSLPALTQPWGIVVAGVGGTGVITIGQLLGVAAHLEGKGIVTQDAAGLAQKGGATWSHILIAAKQEEIHTTRVSTACADLVIGCDPIVSANRDTVLRMRQGRTHVALNHHSTPTAAFVKNANWQDPSVQCWQQLNDLIGAQRLGAFDANAVALKALGDTLFINPMLLGFAWQRGWIPLSRETLVRAIELNDVAVEKNKQAFEWGRYCAHDYAGVEQLLGLQPASVEQPITWTPRASLAEGIALRVKRLTDYQNAAYAQQYARALDKVQAAEARHGTSEITQVVMQELYRLMAYKDEYEVARLHSDPAFLHKLAQQFEGNYRLQFHLAPPLWAQVNERGELQKQTYGAWMLWVFKALRHLKVLRGTPLDVFGYTHERRKERQLIDLYLQTLDAIVHLLAQPPHADDIQAPQRRQAALALAKQPQGIKGFGHVKARQIAQIEPVWRDLLTKR
jgi:indolepyruvate ferredoxin oxidoreductase